MIKFSDEVMIPPYYDYFNNSIIELSLVKDDVERTLSGRYKDKNGRLLQSEEVEYTWSIEQFNKKYFTIKADFNIPGLISSKVIIKS